MNKYHNKKTVVDGINFDSKHEAQRYCELRIMQKSGIITDLELQVPFILLEKSSKGRAVKYIADFVYFDKEKQQEVIEDAKGMKTDVYKLKKRIMAELGYEIVEV